MTARRVLLALLVTAGAVVGFLALRPAPPAPPASPISAASPASPADALLARPVPSPAPSVVAALPPEEVTAAATTVPSSARPTTPSAPAPFVQTFAAQPGVKPLPVLPSPTAPISVPANVDGCDRGYGTRAQCVPWAFPASATDKCAWLAAQGFVGLTVHGTDRHKLDPDKNGIACDA